MAEVFAGYIAYHDDRMGRILDYLEESGQLDNTIIVVVSDNGGSGEGGPNGSFNEWRFFNGVPDTAETDPAPHRRARHPRLQQPLQHRLGVGVRHAVPVLEAVGRRRGRRRRHVHRVVAGADRRLTPPPASSTSTRWTSSRRFTSLLGIEPPEVLKGYQQLPIDGESFAAAITDPDALGTHLPVLFDARSALDLPRRLARLHRAPAPVGVGPLRA